MSISKAMATVIAFVVAQLALPVPSWAQAQEQSPATPAAVPEKQPSVIAIDFGGVYLLQLARQKSVQSDLGVNRTQRQELDNLERRLQKQATESLKQGPALSTGREGISGSRGLIPVDDSTLQKGAEESLASVLTGAQNARLKQIALQQQGPQVLLRPAVVAKLRLTDLQIKAIGRLTPLDSNRVDRVLSGEQRSLWQEMTGPPFRGKLTMSSPP